MLRPAVLLGVVALLGACAAPASAAKGVKKSGEHHIKGRVVAVVPARVGNQGALVIHVTHHKVRKGQVVVQVRGHDRTFVIDARTQILSLQPGVPANLFALQRGTHVTVAALHHHADRVTILHKKKLRVA
jgi:hypothetical protein